MVLLVSCVTTLGQYNRFTNVKCILLFTGMSECKAVPNGVTRREGLVRGAEESKEAQKMLEQRNPDFSYHLGKRKLVQKIGERYEK